MSYNSKPSINTEDLLKLYQTGLSATQIAKKIGMCKSSVSRRIKKSGFPLRKSEDYKAETRYWLWKGQDYIDPITRKRNQRALQKWSKAVRKRDGYKCTRCGKSHKRLHAHHIVRIEDCINTEIEFDTKNGITLCPLCHKQIHKNI